MLAVAGTAAAVTVPLPCGVITCWDGPPTPQTRPANPAGAWGIGTPVEHLCQLRYQPQGLLQLQQVVPKQCQYLWGWVPPQSWKPSSPHAATPDPKPAFLHALAT